MKTYLLAAAAATALLAASPALATPGTGNDPDCPGKSCNPNPPKGGDQSQTQSNYQNNQQGQAQGQGQGQIATGGNATGGASGAIAGAASNAQGGAGGNAQAAGGHSSATGGKSASRSGSSSGGNVQRGGNVNVDASVRSMQAANSAAVTLPSAPGTANCFGDANASGNLGLSVQILGGGISGNSTKQSNVCAAYAVGGPAMAVGYLAAQDPYFRRAAIASGVAITVTEKRRRDAAAVSAPAQTIPTCPTGSAFDGRGCFAPNLSKVRR